MYGVCVHRADASMAHNLVQLTNALNNLLIDTKYAYTDAYSRCDCDPACFVPSLRALCAALLAFRSAAFQIFRYIKYQ